MMQSVLESAGIQAARVESEWWMLFWITTIVTAIVLGVLGLALKRGAARTEPATNDDRHLHRYIAFGTVLTRVILFVILVRSIVTTRALANERVADVMQIEVTAYQWWWSVEYQHPEPEQRVRTANELHLPVGRTVAIKLLASDVIHSFWLPNLHGKKDLVPNYPTTFFFSGG